MQDRNFGGMGESHALNMEFLLPRTYFRGFNGEA